MREKKGIINMLIIKFLSESPSSGYDLIKKIEDILGRRPSSGTIYPALKNLERIGLIEGAREGRRMVYTLTEKGRTHMDRLKKMKMEYIEWYEGFSRAFGEVFPSIKKDVEDMKILFAYEILTPIRELLVELKSRGANEKEIRRVIEETHHKLRSLL